MSLAAGRLSYGIDGHQFLAIIVGLEITVFTPSSDPAVSLVRVVYVQLRPATPWTDVVSYLLQTPFARELGLNPALIQETIPKVIPPGPRKHARQPGAKFRGEIAFFVREILPYLKRLLPRFVGTGNKPGISPLARYRFWAGQMSQFILLCATCDREIMNDCDLRQTPAGRTVCDECAREGYVDVPLT